MAFQQMELHHAVSGWIKSPQLSFFRYLARTAPEEDHHRVIAAALRERADWRRPVVGRPRTTLLRTIDDDLQSLNSGVHTTWRKARDRDVWHQVVSMATLQPGVHTPGGSTLWLWLGGRQEIGTFAIKYGNATAWSSHTRWQHFVAVAWRKTRDRDVWHQVVSMAMHYWGVCIKDEKEQIETF